MGNHVARVITTTLRVAVTALCAVTATLTLTSCSQDDSSASSLTADDIRADAKQLAEDGRTEQAAMLEDGEVTAAEYEDAFQKYSECLTTRGFDIAEFSVSPVDGVSYLFGVDANGRETDDKTYAEQDECRNRYWEPLNTDYSATAPKRMDEGLRQAALACMADAGYTLPSTVTVYADFLGENPLINGVQSDQAKTAEKCFDNTIPKLFPDVTVWQLAS